MDSCQYIKKKAYNFEGMIVDTDEADILFIGGKRKFMQWSVSKKKMIREYNGIMAGNTLSMVQTSNKNYLFVSDNRGR